MKRLDCLSHDSLSVVTTYILSPYAIHSLILTNQFFYDFFTKHLPHNGCENVKFVPSSTTSTASSDAPILLRPHSYAYVRWISFAVPEHEEEDTDWLDEWFQMLGIVVWLGKHLKNVIRLDVPVFQMPLPKHIVLAQRIDFLGSESVCDVDDQDEDEEDGKNFHFCRWSWSVLLKAVAKSRWSGRLKWLEMTEIEGVGRASQWMTGHDVRKVLRWISDDEHEGAFSELVCLKLAGNWIWKLDSSHGQRNRMENCVLHAQLESLTIRSGFTDGSVSVDSICDLVKCLPQLKKMQLEQPLCWCDDDHTRHDLATLPPDFDSDVSLPLLESDAFISFSARHLCVPDVMIVGLLRSGVEELEVMDIFGWHDAMAIHSILSWSFVGGTLPIKHLGLTGFRRFRSEEFLLCIQKLPLLESFVSYRSEIGDDLGPLLRLPTNPLLRRLEVPGSFHSGESVFLILKAFPNLRVAVLDLFDHLDDCDERLVAAMPVFLRRLSLRNLRWPDGCLVRLIEKCQFLSDFGVSPSEDDLRGFHGPLPKIRRFHAEALESVADHRFILLLNDLPQVEEFIGQSPDCRVDDALVDLNSNEFLLKLELPTVSFPLSTVLNSLPSLRFLELASLVCRDSEFREHKSLEVLSLHRCELGTREFNAILTSFPILRKFSVNGKIDWSSPFGCGSFPSLRELSVVDDTGMSNDWDVRNHLFLGTGRLEELEILLASFPNICDLQLTAIVSGTWCLEGNLSPESVRDLIVGLFGERRSENVYLFDFLSGEFLGQEHVEEEIEDRGEEDRLDKEMEDAD